MIDSRPRLRPRDFCRLVGRFALLATVTAAAWFAPATGHAERLRDEEHCVTTLKNAKAREEEGALQAAKVLFGSCSLTPCSTFVRQQCANRHTKLDLDTPTIVLLVSDASGAPRADVQVRVDGVAFVTQIDGRALPIDPGMHDFSFSADGHVFATQKIMIVQGQRNRFITAVIGRAGSNGAIAADETAGPTERQVAELPAAKRLATSPARAKAKAGTETGAAGAKAEAQTDAETWESDHPGETAAPAGKRRLLPWVLAGVGVAGLGAGALFTTWGRRDNSRLVECSPNCDASTLSHIRRIYRYADVSIGVGVAALGAAYWVYAVTRGSSTEEHGSETALHFDLLPTSAGGFASVSGGF